MKTNYKVRYDFAGHKRGAVVSSSDFPAGTNVPALVESQMLSVDNIEPSACPRCVEEGMKRPPKFETIKEMEEHYQEKHAGLIAPTESELEEDQGGQARTD